MKGFMLLCSREFSLGKVKTLANSLKLLLRDIMIEISLVGEKESWNVATFHIDVFLPVSHVVESGPSRDVEHHDTGLTEFRLVTN